MFAKGSLILVVALLFVTAPAFGRSSGWRILEPDVPTSNLLNDLLPDDDNLLPEADLDDNISYQPEASDDGDSNNDVGEEDVIDNQAADDESTDDEPEASENNVDNEVLAFACRFSPYLYAPTCASDGKTYASPYELRCAQDKDESITEVDCDPSNPFLLPLINYN